MNSIEIEERFTSMWKDSRIAAGKSQQYVADRLGVNVRTVQNWEAGLSCPNHKQGYEWFLALDQQPLPYYLRLFYPDEYATISPDSTDEEIEDALIQIIKLFSPAAKRKLLYVFYGDHGSSPAGILNMVVAHLHAPLATRLSVAQTILTNYEVAVAHDKVVQEKHIQPDVELLAKAISDGKMAVLSKKESYSKGINHES